MTAEDLDAEILINAIQERPVLWDKRHKSYHNRKLTHREWEDLAKIFEVTNEIVRKKWKNLKDTFVKEMKKIPKSRSGADGDNASTYKGSWPFFENMSFLLGTLTPRKTEGNIIITIDDIPGTIEPIDQLQISYADDGNDIANDDDNSTQVSTSILEDADLTLFTAPLPIMQTTLPIMQRTLTAANQHSSLTIQAPTPAIHRPLPVIQQRPSPSPATQKQTRKRKDTNLEEFIEIEKEKMKILRQDQEANNDDDILWFKSILPYIKRLPSIAKLNYRTQMQEILTQELSKLNLSHSDSSPSM